MPTVRNLAAAMSRELFDRKETIGLEFVREFQNRGLFEYGTRGGNPDDAPTAGSAHALALFFALDSDAGGPKRACEKALSIFGMKLDAPPVIVMKPASGGGLVTPRPVSDSIAHSSPMFRSLGEHLSKAVAA